MSMTETEATAEGVESAAEAASDAAKVAAGTPGEGASDDDNADAEGAEGAEPNANAGEGEDDGDGELPEWARKKLTKANNEAAQYRTQLREAQDKLKEAKTPADVAEITKGLNDSITKLERDLVIATFQLPEDLASLITGSTREEMEASATILKKYAPAEEPEPREVSGGLNPGNSGPRRENPGELARKHRRRR